MPHSPTLFQFRPFVASTAGSSTGPSFVTKCFPAVRLPKRADPVPPEHELFRQHGIARAQPKHRVRNTWQRPFRRTWRQSLVEIQPFDISLRQSSRQSFRKQNLSCSNLLCFDPNLAHATLRAARDTPRAAGTIGRSGPLRPKRKSRSHPGAAWKQLSSSHPAMSLTPISLTR